MLVKTKTKTPASVTFDLFPWLVDVRFRWFHGQFRLPYTNTYIVHGGWIVYASGAGCTHVRTHVHVRTSTYRYVVYVCLSVCMSCMCGVHQSTVSYCQPTNQPTNQPTVMMTIYLFGQPTHLKEFPGVIRVFCTCLINSLLTYYCTIRRVVYTYIRRLSVCCDVTFMTSSSGRRQCNKTTRSQPAQRTKSTR